MSPAPIWMISSNYFVSSYPSALGLNSERECLMSFAWPSEQFYPGILTYSLTKTIFNEGTISKRKAGLTVAGSTQKTSRWQTRFVPFQGLVHHWTLAQTKGVACMPQCPTSTDWDRCWMIQSSFWSAWSLLVNAHTSVASPLSSIIKVTEVACHLILSPSEKTQYLRAISDPRTFLFYF